MCPPTASRCPAISSQWPTSRNVAAVATTPSARSKPSLFTSLFKGGRSASENDDDEGGASSTPAIPVSVMAAAAPATAANIPMPRAKPARAASYQVASADGALQPTIDANAPPRPPMHVGNPAASDSKPQNAAESG